MENSTSQDSLPACGDDCDHQKDVPEASPEDLAEVEDLMEALKPKDEEQ